MPGLPVHHQLLEFTQTYVHQVGDAIQPSQPLSTHLLPPSSFPSIGVFSSESVLHIRWPKYWSFSFSISPFSEYSGLISFRMEWLDLAVQGTLKKSSPPPQFKSINSKIERVPACAELESVGTGRECGRNPSGKPTPQPCPMWSLGTGL